MGGKGGASGGGKVAPSRGAGSGCGCAPGSRALGQRTRGTRPFVGVYPVKAGGVGFVAPANASELGRGPVQFIGTFDTMPELEPWDDGAHKALAPMESPGGLTLKWSLPRVTDYLAATAMLAPSLFYGASLTLYVAGFDALPADHRKNSWPGTPPGASTHDITTDALAGPWMSGLSAVRPRNPNPALYGDDYGDGGSASDALRYLARKVARPVLDLTAYMGGPGAEADLVELAGGTRYVAVWLRLWWPRWDGVDPLLAADFEVPWQVSAGPAYAPGHRHAWHVSIPVLGNELAAEASLLLPPTAPGGGGPVRYGLCSPISGLWHATVISNSSAAEDGAGSPLLVGLELRHGVSFGGDTIGVAYNDHTTSAHLASGIRHGGSAVISAGYLAASTVPLAGLVCVSVVP